MKPLEGLRSCCGPPGPALLPKEAVQYEIPTGECVSPPEHSPHHPPLAPEDWNKAGTYQALNPAALAARSGAHQLWALSLPCPIALPYRLSLHLGSDRLAEFDCFFYVEFFAHPLCEGSPVAGVRGYRKSSKAES